MRIRIRFFILVSIAFSLFQEPSWCQTFPHWRFWTAADGLSESWSPFISIGPSGRIFCMHGRPISQISYLDGYQVNHLPYMSSIDTAYDRTFFESLSGQFWSNHPIGVQYYKDGKWIQHEVENYDHIRCSILPGAADSVFILSPHELVFFDVNEGVSYPIRFAAATQIGLFTEMISSRNGDLWIAGQNGAALVVNGCRDRREEMTWREYPFIGLDVQDLDSLLLHDDGSLLGTAQTKEGDQSVIVCLVDDSWEIVFSSNRTFDAGWLDVDGNPWLLSFRLDYLYLYHLSLWRDVVVSEEEFKIPSSDRVWAFESTRAFWTKTSRNVARYALPVWRTPAALKNIDTYVNTIYEDPQGRLWYTTVNKLILLDGDERRIYPLPNNFRTFQHGSEDISYLKSGDIAVRTERPFILLFSPEEERFQVVVHPQGKPIVATFNHGDGRMWVQIGNESDYQLDLYDGYGFQTILPRGDDWNIGELRCIFEDEDGALWLGGMSEERIGLYRNGVYRTFGDEYPGNAAMTILRANEDAIWFSDRNNIIQFNGQGWEVILPNVDQVHSMVQTGDGDVWAASWSGLYRYIHGSWIQNTFDDGLPTTDCMEVFEDSLGRIWVGTYHGVSLYHPQADLDPPNTLLVKDQSLYEVSPNGEARFVFSGMDKWKYTQKERLYYSHRVGDGAWSDFTTETAATLSDLKPGMYQFEVRAMDRNFNIDPTPESTPFRVLLPWYQQRGFLVISSIGSLIILILIGFVVHRHFRLRYLVQVRTADLNNAYEQLKTDTMELANAENKLRSMASELTYAEERERRRIATMLHDCVGHALAFAKIKLSSLKQLLEEDQKQAVGDVLGLMDQTIDDLHSLTFELSPPVLHELGFERAVQWLVEELKKQHPVHVQLNVLASTKALNEDISVLLFQSVRELLVNVVKHSRAATAQLTIGQNNGCVIVSLSDNGVGFDLNQLRSDQTCGYGLFSIQQRFKHYGGFVEIESEPGRGVTVTMTTPLQGTEAQ